jgi:hypothetical protein
MSRRADDTCTGYSDENDDQQKAADRSAGIPVPGTGK